MKPFQAIVLIVGLLCIASLVLFALPEKKVPKAEEKAEEKSVCKTDADCTKVTVTCCPCTMGGTERCVPAENVSAYEPKECPPDLVCIALYNCTIARCECIEGSCQAILKE